LSQKFKLNEDFGPGSPRDKLPAGRFKKSENYSNIGVGKEI
jgi:hypothetical protein